MRLLIILGAILACASVALAGDPPAGNSDIHDRVPCGLDCIAYEWDFSVSDWGFTTANCEAGGVSAWQYGNSPQGTVWGTILAGAYPNNTGDGLIAPPFVVTPDAYLMEVEHYYDIETNYDGGNVTVNGVVVAPMGGYDGVISESVSYYAYCVDLEEGFTGFGGWGTDCFDLSDFMGEEVTVEFDFGTDSSVTYDGWYIAKITIGCPDPSPADDDTWGAIKTLFK